MNWDRIEGDWKQFVGKVKEKWGKDQYEIEKMDEGSIKVRDLTRFKGVAVNEPDSSDPTLRNQSRSLS
jgi:hypothetical protein